jgi:hypothetical protein
MSRTAYPRDHSLVADIELFGEPMVEVEVKVNSSIFMTEPNIEPFEPKLGQVGSPKVLRIKITQLATQVVNMPGF